MLHTDVRAATAPTVRVPPALPASDNDPALALYDAVRVSLAEALQKAARA